MITIFSTLKPFRDEHTALIQYNAVQSWCALRPACEVILFGNEEGVAELAVKLGVRHVADIERNSAGLPRVDALFQRAEALARFSILCYVNGDIIFFNDLLQALTLVQQSFTKNFLIVGRRHDIAVQEKLNYQGGQETRLRDYARTQGTLHGPSGIDYFVFPKRTFSNIPPLVIGRGGWDNWMIFNVRRCDIPVVDVTPMVLVLHQNHDQPGSTAIQERVTDVSAMQNITLSGGYNNMYTINDADWVLSAGSLRPPFWIRRCLRILLHWPIFKELMNFKRHLQHRRVL